MKTMQTNGTIADTDTRREQLAALIQEQVNALVKEHLEPAEQAVADADGYGDKPPQAKLAITVSWPAGGTRGAIVCKVSYGKPRKDESETQFDLETQPLPLA